MYYNDNFRLSCQTKQWSANFQHNFSVFYKQWADSTVTEGYFKWKQTTRQMLQKIADWIMFWTITVTLTFNKTIPSFCTTFQLWMMYHQAKFGCKWSTVLKCSRSSHIFITWALTVILTLTVKDRKTILYDDATSLVTKCWFFFFFFKQTRQYTDWERKWLHIFIYSISINWWDVWCFFSWDPLLSKPFGEKRSHN